MKDRRQLYNDFLKVFPMESLKDMTLEQYTDLKKDNSFCYWIEAKTSELGSIWGGSSYKFAVDATILCEDRLNIIRFLIDPIEIQ